MLRPQLGRAILEIAIALVYLPDIPCKLHVLVINTSGPQRLCRAQGSSDPCLSAMQA